jgi:hypothetical protein
MVTNNTKPRLMPLNLIWGLEELVDKIKKSKSLPKIRKMANDGRSILIGVALEGIYPTDFMVAYAAKIETAAHKAYDSLGVKHG